MSLFFCSNTAPIALLEASALTMDCLLRSGIAKIGLEARACIISLKTVS